jgi:hypothetical protein
MGPALVGIQNDDQFVQRSSVRVVSALWHPVVWCSSGRVRRLHRRAFLDGRSAQGDKPQRIPRPAGERERGTSEPRRRDAVASSAHQPPPAGSDADSGTSRRHADASEHAPATPGTRQRTRTESDPRTRPGCWSVNVASARP